MAGRAELNVVVNLISQVGQNIGPLKRDVTQVAKALEQLLSTPVAEQGKGFLALFDIKDADKPIKVIQKIDTAVRQLQLSLKSGRGKSVLAAFDTTDAAKVSAAIQELGNEATQAFGAQQREKFQEQARRFFDLPLEQFEAETKQFKEMVKQLDAASILTPLEGKTGTVSEQYAQMIRRHREALQAMAEAGKEASGAALRQQQEAANEEVRIEKGKVARKKQTAEEVITTAGKVARATVQQYYLASEEERRVTITVLEAISKARAQGVSEWKAMVAQIEPILAGLQRKIQDANKIKGPFGGASDAMRAQAAQLEAMLNAYRVLIDSNVDITKQGIDREVEARRQGAAEVERVVKSQGDAVSAIQKQNLAAEIAAVERALEEIYKARMAAEERRGSLQKGNKTDRDALTREIKDYKAQIEEKLKLLEQLRTKEAALAEESATQRVAVAEKAGTAEVDAAESTAKAVTAVEEKKLNNLQALAEKWATRKKSVVTDSDEVRVAGEAELRAYQQQKDRELEVLKTTEAAERREAQLTADTQVDAANKAADARIEAEKRATQSKGTKDTRIFDAAKTAEALLDIERRLIAEIEQVQITHARNIDNLNAARAPAARQVGDMIVEEERSAAARVLAVWEEALTKLKAGGGKGRKLTFDITARGSTEAPISEKIEEIKARFKSLIAEIGTAKVNLDASKTTEEIKKSTSAMRELGNQIKVAGNDAARLQNEIALLSTTDRANKPKYLKLGWDLTDAKIEFTKASKQLELILAEGNARLNAEASIGAEQRVEIEKKSGAQVVASAKATSSQLESVARAEAEARIRFAEYSAEQLVKVQKELESKITQSQFQDVLVGGPRYKTANTQELEAQLAVAQEFANKARIAAEEAARKREALVQESENRIRSIEAGSYQRSLDAAEGYARAKIQVAEREQEGVLKTIAQIAAKITGLKATISQGSAGAQIVNPEDLKKAESLLKQFEGALDALVQRKHQLIIEGKWKASPVVNLTEGLNALEARLRGLPKSHEFRVQFANARELVAQIQALEEELARLAEEEKRLLSQAGAPTTTPAQSTVIQQQLLAVEQALAKQKQLYGQLVPAAEQAYAQVSQIAKAYAQEDVTATEKAIRAQNQAMVSAAIEGGNELLNITAAAVNRRLALEQDAYIKLLAVRKTYNSAVQEMAEAENRIWGAMIGGRDVAVEYAKWEAAKQKVAEMKTVLVDAGKAYSQTVKDRLAAVGEMTLAEEQFTNGEKIRNSQEISDEEKKNREIEKAYKKRNTDEITEAERTQQELKAIRDRNATQYGKAATTTEDQGFAALMKWRLAQAEEEAYAEKAVRETTAAEIHAFEKEQERQAIIDSRKYAREKADAIKDALVGANKAAGAAGSAIREALGFGAKQGAKDATEAYNAIKREIATIADAARDAGRAARDGSKKDADAAANAVNAAVKRIKDSLTGIGKSWDDAVSGGTTPALNATKMWEDRMNSLSYRFTHVGFQLGIFGAAAMKAFKTPIESAAALAKTIEYTAAIAGGGADKIEILRQAALDLGSTTIYSAEKAAEGMRALVQAGLSAEQAISAVKPVLDFAASGMLNLDDAGRVAISTMNQFGLGLANLPQITNNIQQAANKTNAEVKDFGEALKNVGPTARSVGASLEDTTAALGVLSQAGINASMAGTQLRGIYRRLLEASNESTKAGKIFKELGISVVDSAGNFKDFADIVEEFRQKTADMTETERASKVYEIFGQRAGGPAMVALLNAGAGAIENLKGKIGEAADAATIAAERGEGLWGSIEKLKNAWDAFTKSIGLSGAGPLQWIVEGLTSFVNAMKTALEFSPALKVIVSGFLAIAAVTGGIALAGAAFSLMMANITSVLGVIGPLGRMFDYLKLAMAGATREQIAAAMAARATTVTVNGQTVAVQSLGVAWATAGKAMKAFIIIAAALAAFEVIRAVVAWGQAFSDTNEQIQNAEKSLDRFRGAVAKPLPTKKEFALLTEEQKRAAIKQLSEVERYYIASLQKMEMEQNKRSLWKWVFGVGFLMKDHEKEIVEAKKKLQEAFEAEGYIKIKPKVDSTDAKKQALADGMTIITELDLLFGNKKLGIDKFDISKVIDGLDKAKNAYAKYEEAVKKANENADALGGSETISEHAQNVEKLKGAYEELGIKIVEGIADELQKTRELNDEKIQMVEDYYSVAMEATAGYSEEVDDKEKDLTAKRQMAYDDTLKALDDMYMDAVKKMEQYAEDVLKAEQDLAKERVDAYNWYIEQTEASDKLKSQRQKLRENEEARAKLFTLYDEQMAAGEYKLAEETMGKIQKLVEDANKAQAEDVADALLNEKKAVEQIAELKARIADKEDKRRDSGAEKVKRYGEQEEGAVRRVEEAEIRLGDLRERLSAATTDKERLRIQQQIEAQERRIVDLKEKAATYDEKSVTALEKASEATSSEESDQRKLEKLEAQLTTYKNIIASAGELGEKSRQMLADKEAEERTGRSISETQQAQLQLAEATKRVYEGRIQIHEAILDKARAELKIWEEQANDAKLTKAVIVSLHESLGKLAIADKGSEELKKLQAKLRDQGISVAFTAETKDSRTLQILDIASGKVIKELKIPIRPEGGDEVKQILDRVDDERSKGGIQVFKPFDKEMDKSIATLAKVGKDLPITADTKPFDKALTEAEQKAEQAKLILKFQGKMDAPTQDLFNKYLNIRDSQRNKVDLSFRTKGDEQIKKVTLTLKEIELLKKQFNERGGEFSLKMDDRGIATFPKEFEAMLVSIRMIADKGGAETAKAFADSFKGQDATQTIDKLKERLESVRKTGMGVQIQLKVEGQEKAEKAWLTLEEIKALKTYYGEKGIKLDLTMDAQGFANVPADFQKVLAQLRGKAESEGKKTGNELGDNIAKATEKGLSGISTESVMENLKKMPEQVGQVTTDIFANVTEQTKNLITDASAASRQAIVEQMTAATDDTKGLWAATSTEMVASHRVAAKSSAKEWSILSIFWQRSVDETKRDVERDLVAAHTEAATVSKSKWGDFFESLGKWTKSAINWFKSLGDEAGNAAGDFQGSFGEAGATGGGGRWGGFVKGMAYGGHLPGYGGGDRIPTLLEAGEYVLPKEVVRGIGVETLNNLRAMFLRGMGLPKLTLGIPAMATGGLVKTNDSRSLGVYDINLNIGDKSFPVTGRKDIVEALMETLRRERMTQR